LSTCINQVLEFFVQIHYNKLRTSLRSGTYHSINKDVRSGFDWYLTIN